MDTENTNTSRRILLEDSKPYNESLKWTIHERYFLSRGKEAWLGGEVPYQITSNSAAAGQNASLVYAALEKMEEEGSLVRGEEIFLLEVGAGLGVFAINFLRTFEDIDTQRGRGYLPRLRYLFTDFSEKNLADVSKVLVFDGLAKEGKIIFAVLNALEPATMRVLDTQEIIPLPKLAAVIGNYLHCCLPASILRKEEDTLSEKMVKLYLSLPPAVEDVDVYVRRFVEEPVGERIQEGLREEVSWRPLCEDFFDDPVHREVICECVREYPVATVLYPRGSFRCIQGILPFLRDGGIFLFSDKGYADTSYMEGERACEPSLHGNSFAHSVNFPLLEHLACHLGLSAVRTGNPYYSLQTILIEKRLSPVLHELFTTLFVDGNPNVDSSDYYNAGWKSENIGDYAVANRFYERARQLRPYDAYLYYRLGQCYESLGEYVQALNVLRGGCAVDHFSEHDFAFKIGFILHTQGEYREAIDAYMNSSLYDTSEVTLYNIGLCHENLDDGVKAAEFYRTSLSRNPQYKKARDGLVRLGIDTQNVLNGELD